MIRLLEKNIADKIAAGEVVDRPVSVVKELVENSIDAGASSIVVEIRKGGKEYIRISDNGMGIPKEEISLAFKRHATSKIRSVTDLDCIDTLGFRGEALASISAVSRIKMVTKTDEDKTGTQCDMEGGEDIEISPCGADRGTTIIVSDLFFNTPARRKFMKSDSAEANLIIDLISRLALCYSDVKFRLVNNGNTLFTIPGNGDRKTAIHTIYGRSLGKSLIEVENERNGLKLKAYISNTGESRNNRKSQLFFVNGRTVSSKVLDNSINIAYNERLFPGRFPIVFLFLYVDPKTLDVNIHPTKKEIRFDDDKIIEDFVVDSIKAALREETAVPQVIMDEKYTEVKVKRPVTSEKKKITISSEPEIKINKEEQQVDITEILSNIRTNNVVKEEATPVIQEQVKKPFTFSDLQIIGTLFSTYIVGTKNDAFYLIDQHAAHERVFYEKLLASFDSKDTLRQSIISPIIFDVSPAAEEGDFMEVLNGFGFMIEPFGNRTYRVTEIPMFMALSEAEEFIKDFVSGVTSDTNLKSRNILESLATKACKAAVKAGDSLSSNEIHALFSSLDDCNNPYSCPHGRPTYIRFSKQQIERMFKRA